MSSFVVGRGARLAVWIGLGAAGMLAAPAACLYPDYTFDEPEASSSAGGGTATSSSSSAGAGAEDCSNGADDNGDDLVDCADPACGGFVCTTAVPEGWSGFFALFDGEPAKDPGCPAGFASGEPFVGNRSLVAPPASCTCSCDPAEGQTCAPLENIVIHVSDAPCGEEFYCSFPLETPDWEAGQCKGPNGVFGGRQTCGSGSNTMCSETTGDPCAVSVRVDPLAASGGACAANPVQVEKPPPRWTVLGRACAAAEPLGQGCNAGQVCAPRPAAPFESGLCIAKDGDSSCPPGAYTEKHVFFTDVEDNRSCTDDCTCGAPSGGTCPTNVALYSDRMIDTCMTHLLDLPAGSCTDLEENPSIVGRKVTAPGMPTGGTCAPRGGTASGEARGINPRTFCCRG
ncbi:uncharacterized protein SOCE26_036000 [Sorangium cellulosum]|uniref:Secreted protein n=1 Tax=Sorangium cellulosum TaxID=56 RepID=A0A2L0ES99_SORCE|nr:hypothetical protein [Sorangium cellulosum]AUX42173.1 uncharacterized protein SOCE26_036000 [Sorangium cellulosum]